MHLTVMVIGVSQLESCLPTVPMPKLLNLHLLKGTQE
jgi:hypothetical protein